MATPTLCDDAPFTAMEKCFQTHISVNESIQGAIAGLTLNQKKSLLTVVQNWVAAQK